MKPQVCCRPLLLYQKNPHLIRTPIRSRKKRNRFFIVASTLVATKWLLMLGNFETLGSKFRHETAGLLLSFATISKNPHLIRTPIKSRKKRNRFFIVASTLVATRWLLILAMKPQVCWRPLLLLKKSISLPLQEKKAKHCLTFQLLFSKLLFSFFENNVFT